MDERRIKYKEINSTDEMISMGITFVPMLSVDNSLLGFAAANQWINEQKEDN